MSKKTKKKPQHQLLLPLVPKSLKTFDLFYPGINELAHDTLKNKKHSQFIYLVGPKGSGKSHLLEAYTARALKNKKRILFLPLRYLTERKDYLEDWPRLDAVLIDDLEYLPSPLETKFFHCFNQLQSDQIPLIVTSNLTPHALHFKLPDLKSRMSGALTLFLEPLKDEDLKKALVLHAQHLGLTLNDKIYDFLLHHFERDINHLLPKLKLIAEYSMMTKRTISLALLKEIFPEEK